MQFRAFMVVAVSLLSGTAAFTNAFPRHAISPKHSHQRTLRVNAEAEYTTRESTISPKKELTKAEPALEAKKLKHNLICQLRELKRLQLRDGDFNNIDWGTKGGELTETGRVPRTVDYSLISPDVGRAAQEILHTCNLLEAVSPIPHPTLYLGDPLNGDKAPLNGAWKLLFSNAADAVFSKDSKRGGARTQNVVNAAKSRITNVIDFEPINGTEPVLKQLNVVIKATPVNEKRVQLDFKYAKIALTKFFFLPLFGRTISLYIPVPATFVTRCIELIKRVKRFFTRSDQGEKRSPRGYFDVLYLDDQLRVHKTGQGNLFVQTKAGSWDEAQSLIR